MFIISLGSGQKNTREKIGSSILKFPDNYIVIDTETTGLSPDYNELIEVSAMEIKNGQVIQEYSSLIRPSEQIIDDDEFENDIDYVINADGEKIYYIDNFIMQLTGINNKMLHKAPEVEEVIPKLKEFIGDKILIGHNVKFDINFLYDSFMYVAKTPLENNYIDTMRIARLLLPELEHHRLSDIAGYYKIDVLGSHRALVDCNIAYQCYINLKKDIKKKYENVENFIKYIAEKNKHKYHYGKAKDIKTENQEFDEAHLLYKKSCVFTGTLEKMGRKEAMQIVADLGGFIEDSVTSKTNFLILGNNDYCKTIKDGKSAKHKKAELYKLKGQDIEIIPENVFYDIIEAREI